VDGHGFRARYSIVKRYVKQLRGATPTEVRVIITNAPGEEAQVDYGGDAAMVRDPNMGDKKDSSARRSGQVSVMFAAEKPALPPRS
jgi:hypothetical protein